MKMGRFLGIGILSTFIICLPLQALAAHDSEDDLFEFDQSGYYKDVHLTVATSVPPELLSKNVNEAGEIEISLKPEKSIFSAGELLSFSATVDRDCYLTVLYVSKSGKILVLWPNRESGLNSPARRNKPIRIPARESRFQLQVDGKQPYETIVAYATTGRNNVLHEDGLSDIPGTAFRAFNGTPVELAAIFRDQVEATGNRQVWGTAQLNVRIASPRPGPEEPLVPTQAISRVDGKGFGPVALKARGGGYLSVKDGRISLVKKISPSAIFHLQSASADQVRVMGRYGTINELFDFRSNMFVVAPRLKKTASDDQSGQEASTDRSRQRQAPPVFFLVPVKKTPSGKKELFDTEEIETKGSAFEQDFAID